MSILLSGCDWFRYKDSTEFEEIDPASLPGIDEAKKSNSKSEYKSTRKSEDNSKSEYKSTRKSEDKSKSEYKSTRKSEDKSKRNNADKM